MMEFLVPEIHCAKCASHIRKAVGSVDANAGCEIDVEKKSVHVDSALPPSDFIEALEEAGYPSQLVRALG
ncbi:MAG: heavy-metal-associated domain-containing protein [Usitatibacter sp.]